MKVGFPLPYGKYTDETPLRTRCCEYFGSKTEEVRGWRKIHTEELHNLYATLRQILSDQIKLIRTARHVTRT